MTAAAIAWALVATMLCLFSSMRCRIAEYRVRTLADAKVYWQHQAQCQVFKASQRGRYARSCQMSQARAKVLTKALQINAELGR